MTAVFAPAEAARPLAPSGPVPAPADSTAPLNGPVGSITTKNWVIPPRLKPGRKPATDTPPTKRKAQNRAAQRAFRERRAAKVGELSEQIDEMNVVHQEEVDTLHDQVKEMQDRIEAYEREVLSCRTTIRSLEASVAQERQIKETLNQELAILRGEAVPLPRRNQTAQDKSSYHPHEHSHQHLELPPISDVDITCGNCDATSNRCQCVEEIIAAMPDSKSIEPIKRAHSPTVFESEKKHKSISDHPMEIDFTTQNHLRQEATHISTTEMPTSVLPQTIDPCGFCKDGNTCLCAELAAETNGAISGPSGLSYDSHSRLPSPPPSLSLGPADHGLDYTSSSKRGSCPDGPGSCRECQTDPTRTLFCKSLAASKGMETSASRSATMTARQDGCCGGSSASGGCCKGGSTSAALNTEVTPSQPIYRQNRPTISCADAFTTLSRHPGFAKASEDLGSWLYQLNTIPRSAIHPMEPAASAQAVASASVDSNSTQGRTAFEIDAASVMSVLHIFDRRFASGK